MFGRFRHDARAVSPVVASLILVSTVIIASAGVYVYSTNFVGDPPPAAKSLSITSASPLDGGVKTFTVPSATPQMKWNDILVKLDGVTLNQNLEPGCGAPAAGEWIGCAATTTAAVADAITAGDTFKVNAASGQTLHVLDARANSIILSVIIQ